MDPLTLSAIIGGVGSLASTGGSLFSAGQQRGQQQDALAQAQQNYQLQKQAMEQQQLLATAGRTDAAGNKVYWNGQDWVTVPTAATKGIIDASQKNEREQQVKGGIRREIGQETNFNNRLRTGEDADAILSEFEQGAGAPTRGGVAGRNLIAATTRVGENRDSLVDAMARNIIRSGTQGPAASASLDAVDNSATGKLRTAIAESDANAPESYRQQREGWETGMLNKFAPLNAIRTNISDTAVAPTGVGAPIDAQLGQAASYGAATSGRNATAVNQGSALIGGINPSPIPYGPAAGALTDAVMAYIKRTGGTSPSPTQSQENYHPTPKF